MCGITGILTFGNSTLDAIRLKPMVDAIAHRGPDDAGYLVFQTGKQHSPGVAYGQAFTDSVFHDVSPLLPTIDSDAGGEKLHEDTWDLFMGHRRLSIIDLSVRGHQPMSEKTQNIWISYNGEIYNFRELRDELSGKGHNFSSGTDTEVVLHAYEEWGIECVKRFNGMFAFACRVPIGYKLSGFEGLQKLDENLLRKKKIAEQQGYSGKNILRNAMQKIMPSEIIEARKQGVSAPDESWFRGQAEQFVRDELLSSSSRIREYMNQDFIRNVLDEHSSGANNRRLLIWSLLSFETWLRQFQ